MEIMTKKKMTLLATLISAILYMLQVNSLGLGKVTKESVDFFI